VAAGLGEVELDERILDLGAGDTVVTFTPAGDTGGATKCMVIESPVSGDSFLFFKADAAITITHVNCLSNAATSTILTVQECNSNGGSCGTTEAAMTCATTNTAESGGIDDSTVTSGEWMRVLVGTVTGTPGHVTVCVSFTY